jgi:DNA invertase Pin-like site-specific DNA recombinase
LTLFVKRCYDNGVDHIPSNIQARRAVEDRAIRLGEQRLDLNNRVAANTQAIIDLLANAADAGVPFDHVATLVGITRQTLYRWQEVARRLRESRQAD